MGTYAQWRAATDAGEQRRATWVAGPEAVLVEEVIDTTRTKLGVGDLDYVSLSYSTHYDRQVWAAANQYSLTPGANRLVLVRDAEKLTRFDQLTAWLNRIRELPGVHLLFVSNEDDLPYEGTGNRRRIKDHVAQLRAPKGRLVRCTQQSEADALAWLRRHCTLDDTLARHLLTRTGGNLGAAAAVCTKLALFSQAAGTATIDALVIETPATDFSDNLIALDKRRAILTVSALRHDDYFKITALLDSRLDLLAKLHRLQIAGQTRFEVSGVSPFLQRRYLPHARHYDQNACTKRRRLLAVIDDALRTGARDAVLEALVACW